MTAVDPSTIRMAEPSNASQYLTEKKKKKKQQQEQEQQQQQQEREWVSCNSTNNYKQNICLDPDLTLIFDRSHTLKFVTHQDDTRQR